MHMNRSTGVTYLFCSNAYFFFSCKTVSRLTNIKWGRIFYYRSNGFFCFLLSVRFPISIRALPRLFARWYSKQSSMSFSRMFLLRFLIYFLPFQSDMMVIINETGAYLKEVIQALPVYKNTEVQINNLFGI